MFNASMNFALGDEIEALRQTVHRWAQDRLAPIAAEIDKSNKMPAELWREMGELGLLGITVEEEFGGVNMGYLAHTVAVEEVARERLAADRVKRGGDIVASELGGGEDE